MEHTDENQIVFDFEADTVPNTASISGTNLWLVTVYGSFDPNGAGTLRIAETTAVASESTSLTAGDPFHLDNVRANLDLSDFICKNELNQQLHLCVQLERNTELADPIFSMRSTPDPFILCKEIECKGKQMLSLQLDCLSNDFLHQGFSNFFTGNPNFRIILLHDPKQNKKYVNLYQGY